MSDSAAHDTATNAGRIRAAYAHWEKTLGQDPAPFFALMDERVEMASILGPEDIDALAEGHRGIERVQAYFAALAANWAMVDFPTHKIVEQGDTVVWIGRCTWRNRHTRAVVGTPKVDIWTFRDGKAVKFLEMFDTLGFARGAGLLRRLAMQG